MIIVLIEGRRDNYGYLQKNQEKTNHPPATRSPFNYDGIFHYSYELNAYIIDRRCGQKMMLKSDFCQTDAGQAIFSGIETEGNLTALDVVLQLLEIKLSRTDSGSEH